jgi:tetratricopeptide (TPR) repeat protein
MGHGNRGCARRPFFAASVVICLTTVALVSTPGQPSAPAQAAFQRGMTALHNFEYEQANDAFREARMLDPSYVLAYWGEAMTFWQTLWRNENAEAARQVLDALAPSPQARRSRAGTAKERALLGAVDLLFGDAGAETRHERYADAMGKIAADYPDDPDLVSLYGLALLGTTSRSLIGFDDAHDERLAGSNLQRQTTALLNGVLATHPQHPGALHYLLHAYDDPQHAPLALEAARRYARVANGASHALHMPAHIFLQLGLWQDAAASDRAAYDASGEWVRRKGLPLTLRNYHALSWLQYELLQLGRFAEAGAAIAEIEPVVKAGAAATQAGPKGAHQPLLSDLSSMRARYAIETRRWNVMAGETEFGNVDDLFAIGMSAARAGDLSRAHVVRQALAERATAPQEGDLRPAIAIMENEMAALIELGSGRQGRAIEILRSAARSELDLPAPLGLPEPIKPAPELLGEVLVEAGRPDEAVEHFESVLRLHANRSLSVSGLARAVARSGDAAAARRRYQELLATYDHADADLPDLLEARAALARPEASADPVKRLPIYALGGAAVTALVVIATIAAILRRRCRRSPPKSSATSGRAARASRRPR